MLGRVEHIPTRWSETDLLIKTADGSPDWLWEVDTELRYTSPSRKRAELFGCDGVDLVGRSLLDDMAVNDAQRLSSIFDAIKVRPRPFSGVVCRYFPNEGMMVVLESTGVPILRPNGEIAGYRGIDRDVTPTGLLSLDGRLAQLETIYATLPIALCVIDRQGRLLAVNNIHASLAQRPISSLIGVRVADLHAQAGKNIERDFRVFDAGGTVPEHEIAVRDRTYLVAVAPLHNALGQVEAITVAHMDITKRKELETELAIANTRLSALSSRDHLTGLFNRRHFDDVLAREVGRLRSKPAPLSLLMIDVDYFKPYNDSYGHLAGDDCLQDVAACLAKEIVGDAAILCRYGGEEFGAILPGASEGSAAALAERCRSGTIEIGRKHRESPLGVVTISIGLATTNEVPTDKSDREHGEHLILLADKALYEAKRRGRNCVAIAPTE